MSGEDHDARGGRRRRSWREIDQMRESGGRGREERRPRDDVRSRAAAQQYVRKLDHLFSTGRKAGAEAERLARALRAAHGTPELAGACRAYRDALGLPADPALLAIFLDAGEPELVVEALQGLANAASEGGVEITSGLRTRLRLLAQDSNDEVAEAAEEILESL